MQKISLNLPGYRLQADFRLIKRRKVDVAEPLLLSLKHVKRKYRTGTILSRYFRHIFDHKYGKKLVHSSMAIVAAGTVLMPQTTTNASASFTDAPATVIQAETTLVTQKGIQAPLPSLKINQKYSYFHPGIDFGGSVGEPVKAIKKGVVVFAGYTKDGYGNNVVINHGQGIESLYAHLSKIQVKTGEEVDMDKVIGQVGISGRTTGPHLHIEVRQSGTNINPLSVIR